MLAFHNDPAIKAMFLARIAAHAAADEIVKGAYWENGQGCAIGCTYHTADHMASEREAGIPVALAHLEDHIFESLPNDLAMTWPHRFMSAVPVGADLGMVGPKFALWLIRDSQIPGMNHRSVKHAIEDVIDVLETWCCTGLPDSGAALDAACSAGGAATRVRSVASSHAAGAAASAADAACKRSPFSIAQAASSAALARSPIGFDVFTAYVKMSDALLGLIRDTEPVREAV